MAQVRHYSGWFDEAVLVVVIVRLFCIRETIRYLIHTAGPITAGQDTL